MNFWMNLSIFVDELVAIMGEEVMGETILVGYKHTIETLYFIIGCGRNG